MNWTEEQKQAIEVRNSNILVSAAAGSGKTAVLVERIKRLIIEEKTPISEMLIVTFTNAAAAEMREKITKSIKDEIKDNPSQAVFLRKQLNDIYIANISTFHAFALEIIRRYFYLINVDPNFKICDEAQGVILREQAMDKLFEELFELKEPLFFDFLNKYSNGRNEDNIRNMIKETYYTLQSVPEPELWIEENLSKEITTESFYNSYLYDFMLKDIKSEIMCAYNCFEDVYALLEQCGVNSLAVKCKAELDRMGVIIEKLNKKDFFSFSQAIRAYKGERYIAKKDEKEEYEQIKEMIKYLRDRGNACIKNIIERYLSKDVSEYVKEIQNTRIYLEYLCNLVRKFKINFCDLKEEKGLIDFNDIEHFALNILKDEDVAQEYRNKFSYIFIDEYQDSNIIQDTLINSIKRKNNLFMVGDVKQSIYKFRLAEPEIFLEKYARYDKDKSGTNKKIDLNKNFRSKGNIIDSINKVFEVIMDDYDDKAKLYEGNIYRGKHNHKPVLYLMDTEKQDDLQQLPEEIKELKTVELEAYAACEIIKNSLGSTIFDAKEQVERGLQKKDIVILMRSTKNYADKFQKILYENNIMAYVEDSQGYFDTIEIDIFLSLLKIIDNKNQDLPLLTVLFSAILDFSAEELIKIRLLDNKLSYANVFMLYSKKGTDECLQKKCSEALEKIINWRKMSTTLALSDFLWKLMWNTGYYTYYGAFPGGEQRQANMRALIDKAVAYQQINTGSLYGFINYIDAIKKREISVGQVSLVSENDDVVRIMTIHKSKGLEFPMVLLAGMGRKFNYKRNESNLSMHKDLGIGLKHVNDEEHWYKKTLVQNIIERKISEESIEEEIRILYVAFTRAMDQLILLGTVKNYNQFIEKSSVISKVYPSFANSYLELITPVVKDFMEIRLYDRSTVNTEKTLYDKQSENIRDLMYNGSKNFEDNDIMTAVIKRLSYDYRQNSTEGKSKYSVSELSRENEIIEFDYQPAIPKFIQVKKNYTSAEQGTILHEVMQHLELDRFRKPFGSKEEQLELIKKNVDDMVKNMIILGNEITTIDFAKIQNFINSRIGRRLLKSQTVYRELPFTFSKIVETQSILIQGIIDCCFVEDGEYVIIDYKTNKINSNISVEKITEMYRGQMQLYKEAIEQIKGKKVKQMYLYLFEMNKEILL